MALALFGCYLPVTHYKASADGGIAMHRACPGHEDYVRLLAHGVRLTFHATVVSEEFWIYIWADDAMLQVTTDLDKAVRIDLSKLSLMDVASQRFYQPTQYGWYRWRSTSSLFDSPYEEVSRAPLHVLAGRVRSVHAQFPSEAADVSRLVLTLPEVTINGVAVRLPAIEFERLRELRGFVLNC